MVHDPTQVASAVSAFLGMTPPDDYAPPALRLVAHEEWVEE